MKRLPRPAAVDTGQSVTNVTGSKQPNTKHAEKQGPMFTWHQAWPVRLHWQQGRISIRWQLCMPVSTTTFGSMELGAVFFKNGAIVCYLCLVAQSCPILFDPLDCSLSGFSVHGIFQAKILEWGAISCSRESSQPRDQTQVSWVSCIAGADSLPTEPWGEPKLPLIERLPSTRHIYIYIIKYL